MSDLPRIMVGGPVRDREWSVPLWLGGLLASDYPRHLVTVAVLINDSRDGTEAACRWWGQRAADEGFGRVVIQRVDFGCAVDNNVRRERDYRQFARVRDAWVALRREEELLFPVDSDIQVPRRMLPRLVELARRDRVSLLAGIIHNNVGTALHFSNVLRLMPELCADPPPTVRDRLACLLPRGRAARLRSKRGRADLDANPGLRYVHILDSIEDRESGAVRPCDWTGACLLIHRRVFDAGLRYDLPGVEESGEDLPFMDACAAAGFRPHYTPDPLCRATHYMAPPVEFTYLADRDHHLRLAAYHADHARRLEAARRETIHAA